MDAMDEITATLNDLVKMSTDDPSLLTVLIGMGYETDYTRDLLLTAVTELSTARALLSDLEWIVVGEEIVFFSCPVCYEAEGTSHKTDCRLIFITSNDATRHLRGVELKEETTLVVDFYETGIGIRSGEVHNEIRARYR